MFVPSCDGCGALGYYGVCDDCRTPDYGIEDVNRNTRRPSHNDENFAELSEW
jgi:hypothetical protein